MKNVFSTGAKKSFLHKVVESDMATFESGTVHAVYSTFSIARDAEWCCRLFVLDMKEEDEEGIGTFVNVMHQSPALLGSEVVFEAEIAEMHGNTINCNWTAMVNDRLIAKGTQGQKILKRERLNQLFEKLKQ